MPYKLIGKQGAEGFQLPPGASLVVGRAIGCDIPVVDQTVSRRHAEITLDAAGVRVRDMGSSNGTFLNGARIASAAISVGDVISFGAMAFRLEQTDSPSPADSALSDEVSTVAAFAAPSTLREMPVDGVGTRFDFDIPAGRPRSEPEDDRDLNARKLATLLEVSKGLTRAVHIDHLLDKVARYVFQIMDVDRVSIMLTEDDGTLVSKVSRDRQGTDAGRAVPQSIARKVVDGRVAIVSDNAPEDGRFGGSSIIAQRVRSAMCAPLIGSEDRVLGVLYVDNLTTTHRFTDGDLEYLIAFAGIAAVSIENSSFAERIRREALVRGNYERYFAPALAARIAESPGAVRLGGTQTVVVVLFSDIRDFTALSAAMAPDDTALQLSEYLSAMVDCVFEQGGMLDKFIGDSVMAQWGAPISGIDDADRAVKAALNMLKELERLNAKWRNEGRPTLQVGIGIDSGKVFAGNIGSERRLEFTVIGDAVNTAARLCAVANGGDILVTSAVRNKLRSPVEVQECPPLALKGTDDRVPVHRITA
ncbi:MAG: FHA domain-containing protein [Anaerolineae bacterium]|nr:FHA domain-containing protein [Gemmatimonadaceae bacterium]